MRAGRWAALAALLITPSAHALTQCAVLTATPNPIAFGGQTLQSTSAPVTVTISDIFQSLCGNDVTISAVTSSSPQFAITRNTCASLAVGQGCQVDVTYTSAATPGPVSATLNVTYALVSFPFLGATVQFPLTGTAETSLVSHYYQSILRRQADVAGKAFWESERSRIVGLGANVNEAWYAMAMGFFASAEYAAFARDDTGFVTDLYNTFFNRPPDSAGITFWKGQIASGMPRGVALVSFMFSSEFQAYTQGLFGNTTARAEVDVVGDFYRGLLARLPDSGGFNNWVLAFRTAQCQGTALAVSVQAEAISSAFVGSAEFANRNRSHAEFVGDLYNAFLRRGGDLPGVQFWISQLAGGASRDDVRRQFVNSPEFSARVAAVIAQGCM